MQRCLGVGKLTLVRSGVCALKATMKNRSIKERIWASESYTPPPWHKIGQLQGWNTGSCFIFFGRCQIKGKCSEYFERVHCSKMLELGRWHKRNSGSSMPTAILSSILSSSFFPAKKMWLHIVAASRSNRVMISTLLLLFSIVWKGPVLLIISFNKRAQKLPGLALRSQWVSSWKGDMNLLACFLPAKGFQITVANWNFISLHISICVQIQCIACALSSEYICIGRRGCSGVNIQKQMFT